MEIVVTKLLQIMAKYVFTPFILLLFLFIAQVKNESQYLSQEKIGSSYKESKKVEIKYFPYGNTHQFISASASLGAGGTWSVVTSEG